jgi:hypothetical protein
MNTTNTHTPQQRQAVFFYPKSQYFKVDTIAKKQLGEPVLLFIEQYPGHSICFFNKLHKDAAESFRTTQKQITYSVYQLEQEVKNNLPYNMNETF